MNGAELPSVFLMQGVTAGQGLELCLYVLDFVQDDGAQNVQGRRLGSPGQGVNAEPG